MANREIETILDQEIIIPRSFQKQGWKLWGMSLVDWAVTVVVVLSISVPTTIIMGFSWGSFGVIMASIFVSLMIVFPIGQDKIKMYKYIARWINYIPSTKQFGGKSKTPTSNAFPFNRVEDFAAQSPDGKNYMGVILLGGIDLPLFSELDQDSKIHKLNSMFESIDGAYQIVTAPRKKDYSLNIKALEKRRADLLASYLIEYLPKHKMLTSEGELLGFEVAEGVKPLSEEEFNAIVADITDALPEEARFGFSTGLANIEDSLNELRRFDKEGIAVPRYFIVCNAKNIDDLADRVGTVEGYAQEIGLDPQVLVNEQIWAFASSYFTKDHHKLHSGSDLATVLPNSITFKKGEIIFKNSNDANEEVVEHKRIITITALQKYASPYWLSNLLNTLAEHQVIYRTKEYSGNIATKKINKALFAKKGQIAEAKYASEEAAILREIEAMEQLNDALASQSMKLESIVMHIVVSAKDSTSLKWKVKEVASVLYRMGLEVAFNTFRQFDAYASTLPTSMHELEKNELVVIPSIATALGFPFTNESFQDRNAPILATAGDQPVMLDFRVRNNERKNSNFTIMGTSGSGKSFLLKKTVKDFAAWGNKCFIIDPEGEYEILAKNVGGQIIDMNDTSATINPLEIIPTVTDNDDAEKGMGAVTQHLQFLEAFFMQSLAKISELSLASIIHTISSLYLAKGYHTKDISKIKSTEFPLLSDVLTIMKKDFKTLQDPTEKMHRMEAIMALEGIVNNAATAALWDRHTKIKIQDKPLIVFDIHTLNPKENKRVAGAQLVLAQKYIDKYISVNKEKYWKPAEEISYKLGQLEALGDKATEKQVKDIEKLNLELKRAKKLWGQRWIVSMIDEAHLIFDKETKYAVAYIYTQFKRIRKYNGIAGLITQSITDFKDPEIQKYTDGILNSAQYSFVFKLQPGDITALHEMYHSAGGLTNSEMRFLTDSSTGQMLMFITSKRRFICQTETSQAERYIMEGRKE